MSANPSHTCPVLDGGHLYWQCSRVELDGGRLHHSLYLTFPILILRLVPLTEAAWVLVFPTTDQHFDGGRLVLAAALGGNLTEAACNHPFSYVLLLLATALDGIRLSRGFPTTSALTEAAQR